jgi:hypothetical protein
MKFKKMFIFLLIALVFSSCESGFEDMMDDSNEGKAALKSVNISEGSLSPEFKRDVISYTLNQGVAVSSFNITAIPLKSDSTMKYRFDNGTWTTLSGLASMAGPGGDFNFSKLLEIEVTSDDGDAVLVYNFNVTAVSFKVTYSANGATAGSIPVDNSKYKAGDTVTVLQNTGSLINVPAAGTGEAFKFGGWNTKADGSGDTYATDGTIVITNDITIYAKWVKFELRDRGSANGWIFYDKGSYSGGWRYLELYPDGFSIHTSSAATQAASFPPNDWYIPAKEEMRYMYDNLVLFDTKAGSSSGLYKFLAGIYGTSTEVYSSYYTFVSFYTTVSPNNLPDYSDSSQGIGQYLQYRAIRKF